MSFEPIQKFFELSEFQRFFCYRHEECESFENLSSKEKFILKTRIFNFRPHYIFLYIDNFQH